MQWMIGFSVALLFLVTAVVLVVIKSFAKNRSSWPSADKILFIGVALSAVSLFVPIYIHVFDNTAASGFETFVISVHNMIRLFVIDCDFEFIVSNISPSTAWLASAYSVLFSVLYVTAPILTFSFVLSFFENALAYRRLFVHYNADLYVFSELNEKSLELAQSLYEKKRRKQLFVFTDVFLEEEESSFELCNRAKAIGAVCFKNDIVTLNCSFHSKNSNVTFFAIGNNQSENVNQALKLIERYRTRENTQLYVFADQLEAELLLFPCQKADETTRSHIRVRRVQEDKSLVFHLLYDKGTQVFDRAVYCDEDGQKHIGAVVVGSDECALHMAKALPWFCQMDGYRAQVYGCFTAEGLCERMKAECPELLDENYNGNFDVYGEAQYKLTIWDALNSYGQSFYEILESLPYITYVFVSCGNDEDNIRIGVNLRSLFKRLGYNPAIHVVVRDSDKQNALAGICDFKGNAYDIEFIGDLQSEYSCDTLLDCEMEQVALARHKRWGDEDSFWRFNYNYSSSIASAIHQKMKRHCRMAGMDKQPSERTDEQRRCIRVIEHRRWNAYMRSIGYSYAPVRDDIAKTHHDLVPFEQLKSETQAHDDD